MTHAADGLVLRARVALHPIRRVGLGLYVVHKVVLEDLLRLVLGCG